MLFRLFCACLLPCPAVGWGYFLQLADLHLDTYYNTPQAYQANKCGKNSPPYGEYGCDSPKALSISTLEAASKTYKEKGASFLVFNGDFVRHRDSTSLFPASNEEALGVVSTVTNDIIRYFGKTADPQNFFWPTIGNTDDIHYMDPTPGKLSNTLTLDYFKQLYAIWKDLLPAGASETFPKGGYYSGYQNKIHIIAINSMLYSTQNPYTDPFPDPFDQFDWLEKKLQNTVDTAYIIGHIPPICNRGGINLWKPNFAKRYLDLVDTYKAKIGAQLFAHTHNDEFRTFGVGRDYRSPLYITSAVSPLWDNNPSFRLWEYDVVSKDIHNYYVYYTDLAKVGSTGPSWRLLYDATSWFSLTDMHNIDFYLLVQRWVPDTADKNLAWQKYEDIYRAGHYWRCTGTCRDEIICLYSDIQDCCGKTQSGVFLQQGSLTEAQDDDAKDEERGHAKDAERDDEKGEKRGHAKDEKQGHAKDKEQRQANDGVQNPGSKKGRH